MATALETLLRRDRWVVAGGLVLIAGLAWAYLLAGAGMEMQGPEPATWSTAHTAVNYLMWAIMMTAMMLPSAAPTILLAAALNRRSAPNRPPYGRTGSFVAGYLLTWAVFSALAVAAQWALARSDGLSPALAATSTVLSGILLLGAGLWQLTPAKRTCLRHCQSPIHFLTRKRRSGNLGAILMGTEHGAYCLACCWFLMALLFVGGIMNLTWIVGLSVLVLVEKLLPAGQRLGRLAGAALLVWGVVVLVGGL